MICHERRGVASPEAVPVPGFDVSQCKRAYLPVWPIMSSVHERSLRHPVASYLVAALIAGCAAGPRAAAPTSHHDAAPASPTGTIEGVVLDAVSGGPVSFVDVKAASVAGHRMNDTTGSDGSFRFTDVPVGTYWVTAIYSGHSVRYRHVTVTAGGSVHLDVPLDPEREDVTLDYGSTAGVVARSPITPVHTGSIRGLVRDAETREELPGAVVAATAPVLRDARMAMADDNGSYLLPSLPPGTYTLSVYYHLIDRGNLEIRRTNITVAPGEIKVVDLDLDAETEK